MTNTDDKEGKIDEIGGIEKEEETKMCHILEDSASSFNFVKFVGFVACCFCFVLIQKNIIHRNIDNHST